MGEVRMQSPGVDVQARAHGDALCADIGGDITTSDGELSRIRAHQVATTPAAYLMSRVVLRPRRDSTDHAARRHLGGLAELTDPAGEFTTAKSESLRTRGVTLQEDSSDSATTRLAEVTHPPNRKEI